MKLLKEANYDRADFAYRLAKLFSKMSKNEIAAALNDKYLSSVTKDLINKVYDAFVRWRSESDNQNDFNEFSWSDAALEAVGWKYDNEALKKAFEEISQHKTAPALYDENTQKQLFNEVVRRLRKIDLESLKILQHDYEFLKFVLKKTKALNARDFFMYVFIWLYSREGRINSKNTELYLSALESFKEWFVDECQTEDGQDRFLTNLEELIDLAINRSKAIAEFDLREELIKLHKLFIAIPKSQRKTFKDWCDTATISSQAKVILNEFLHPTSKEIFTKIIANVNSQNHTTQEMISILHEVQEAIKNGGEAAKKIEGLQLNKEQKEILSDIIQIIRAMKSDKIVKLVDYTLSNERIFSMMQSIASNDPDVSEASIKILARQVIYQNMMMGDLSLYEIQDCKNAVEKKIIMMRAVKDPDFLKNMHTLVDLIKKVRFFEAPDFYGKFRDLRKIFNHNKDEDVDWPDYLWQMASQDDWFSSENETSREYAALCWSTLTDQEKKDLLYEVENRVSEAVKEYDYENKKLKKIPPEASAKAPLEKYAFADQRKGEVPREQNSEKEQVLYNALRRHFNDNDPLAAAEVDMIRTFLKNGQYSKIFKSPKQEYVYRGMSVEEDFLRKAMGLKQGDKLPRKGSKTTSFTYTPKTGETSSWSVSPEAAKKFATKSRVYQLMLIAKTKDNKNSFVLGPDGLYSVRGLGDFEYEKETIGLGKIKVYKIIWAHEKTALAVPKKK